MHIPGSMLHGAVCPVTAALTVAGAGVVIYFARQAEDQPSAMKFAAVTSMIFALQMLNFPVQNGTSGHLLGGALAVMLLGFPLSVVAMAMVLTVQAVFFADGGINALGANILNMGIIAPGVAALALRMLSKKNVHQGLALGIASWVSVVCAALACALEISLSGAVDLNKAIVAMGSIHALIGLGEAGMTVVVVSFLTGYASLWQDREQAVAAGALGAAVTAAMISPLASNFPDGLAHVMSTLAQYHVPVATTTAVATVAAGLTGVCVVFLLSQGVVRLIRVFKR
ncbi:MAG: energy-coupling factor ABC transporter permease [Candidatus Omnitrophica bacterium]|nr:energy-coupling factor ABC transporter permease [Candidatus Omnitrophota bacterium]